MSGQDEFELRSDGESAHRIVLDTNRCSGLGICEATAPGFFEIQDDGSNAVLRAIVTGAELNQVRTAVMSCPTQALSLRSREPD